MITITAADLEKEVERLGLVLTPHLGEVNLASLALAAISGLLVHDVVDAYGEKARKPLIDKTIEILTEAATMPQEGTLQ